MYKIVREIGEKPTNVGVSFHQIARAFAVRQVRRKAVFVAVSPGVSGAPQVGGAPGAGVHARSSATSSFGGARLAR